MYGLRTSNCSWTCDCYTSNISPPIINQMAFTHPDFDSRTWYPGKSRSPSGPVGGYYKQWTRYHTRPIVSNDHGNFATVPLGPYWAVPLPLAHRTYYGQCAVNGNGLQNACNDQNGFFAAATDDGRCICVNGLGMMGCSNEAYATC